MKIHENLAIIMKKHCLNYNMQDIAKSIILFSTCMYNSSLLFHNMYVVVHVRLKVKVGHIYICDFQ